MLYRIRAAAILCAFTAFWGCKPRTSSTISSEEGGAAQTQCGGAIGQLANVNPDDDQGRPVVAAVFKTCFQEYLRIDTVNPPGNEQRAADFFASVFAAAGIDSRRIMVPQMGENGDVKTRVNLIASIGPEGTVDAPTPSVLFMNHTDTVSFHADQWRQDTGQANLPFSGAEVQADGEAMVFGRGAIDMKDIGIAQMMAMVLAKYRNVPLKNQIHFLGVADEEANASGVQGMLAEVKKGGQLAELRGAKVAFNEGGFGIKGALGAGSEMQFVGVEERGGAWLKLTEPSGDTDAMFAALSTLQLMPTYSTSTQLAIDKAYAATHRWNCTVGGFNTPDAKVNVVPSIVEILMHCRKPLSQASLDRVFNFQTEWQALKADFGCDDGIPEYTVRMASTGGDAYKITVATASSGHGSLGAISALDIAAWGLQKMRAIYAVKKYPVPEFMRYQLSAATSQMLNAVAKSQTFTRGYFQPTNAGGWLNKLPGPVKQSLVGVVTGQAGVEKTFRTACTLTALTRKDRSGPLEALVDCRLINQRPFTPGSETHPQEFLRQVRSWFTANKVFGVRAEVTTGWNFTSSPLTGAYFDALTRALKSQFPNASIAPLMIPGGTDSSYFRDTSLVQGHDMGPGIPAYGFTPAMVGSKLVETFHGSDERFPVSQMAPAALTYYALLKDLGNSDLP